MMEWLYVTDGEFGHLFDENSADVELFETVTVMLGEQALEVKAMNRAAGHTTSTTGLMCWEGGVYLSDVIFRAPDLFKGKTIIELGAGCVPLPSLSAAHIGASHCIITDGSQAVLDIARSNIRAVTHQIPSAEKCSFLKLVWDESSDIHALLDMVTNVDWILGADVVYNESGTQSFFQTVKALMDAFPNSKLLLSFMVRGVGYNRIISLAEASGLQVAAVPSMFVRADDGPIQLMSFIPKKLTGVLCMKCRKASAQTMMQQGNALCAACLLSSVETKFRYQFKTKAAIRPGDRVMIEGTGTIETQTVLDLLLQSRHPDAMTVRRGKTHFHLIVLHQTPSAGSIDPCSCTNELLDAYGGQSDEVEIVESELGDMDWHEVFPELDETSCRDLERIRRHKGLLKAARDKGCNILVSPESSTALAAGLLSLSCKGGGYGVADRLELFDRRFASTGVTVVRLLKGITASELAFYCHFKKLPTCSVPLESVESVDSIDAAAEAFVHTLKEAFPSGVSSVLRTAAKLKHSQPTDVVLCSICSEPIESQAEMYCYPCGTHIVNKLSVEKLKKLMELLNG